MITRWNIDELYHSEDELYHHGVLGMRWGHRKSEYRTNSERRRAIAKKAAIGAGIAGAVAGGAVLAKRSGVRPLRAVKSAAGTIGSKFSRTPKIGTVSKASLGKMTSRHTAGVGSKYLRTPTLNGYFNGQRKALSVGKKPISSLNRSGSGQVKRMLQRNGNVKVSKIKMLPSPAEPQMQGPVWKPNRLKTLKATKVGENSGITWARSRMPDGNGGRSRIRFRGTRYTERTPILGSTQRLSKKWANSPRGKSWDYLGIRPVNSYEARRYLNK